MSFKEIDITKIIEEKCQNDPEFKAAYAEAYAELDLIAQIIKLRKAKGLTQGELADKAGLTQQMISRIERRTQPPNYRNLIKIAEALDSKLQLV